jgi:hypothetical protein
MSSLSIIGAGLSGLIAATQFPQATVFEANGPESIAHKAVLRFRSDVISRLVGIPFKRVNVRKSVFSEGRHRPLDITMANLYSRKTNGQFLNRSIWNLDPVDRFIAPEDFQLQLAELIGNRLNWNSPVHPPMLLSNHAPIISTMPMSVLAKMLGHTLEAESLTFKSIKVDRYRVPGADLYQTIYYPDPLMNTYRSSITGDLLIVEKIEDPYNSWDQPEFVDVLNSFGLQDGDVELIEAGHRQRFGKIAPINNNWRRNFIYEATVNYQIYSLGRFATWRNIILDDVIDDIAIVKRLLTAGKYGAQLQHLAKGNENGRL